MIKTALKLLLMLLIYTFAAKTAQAQRDVCKLMAYFVEDRAGSSSNFLIAKFTASVEDETVTKSFLHEESGVTIRVGVSYYDDILKQIPKRIKLAIAFTGEPDMVFNETDNAEAETFRGKGWLGLFVRKSIRVQNRVYTFTLSCEKEQKARKLK